MLVSTPFLIDQVVVIGIAAVLPLALRGRWWWWGLSALVVATGLTLPTGPVAATSVGPLAAALSVTGLRAARAAGPLASWGAADGVRVLAAVYGLVGAGALAASRLGLTVFHIGEPIVELTAVHYLYAGTGALVLAGATLDGPRPRAGRAAVLLTAAAPPIVAAGFVTGGPLAQVGGALVMTAGVGLTAALQLAAARAGGPALPRVLLALSGLAIWAPMALAVAWAAAQHWAVPSLSIPDMARTHGLANALGFTLAGLVARRLQRAPACLPST